MSFVEYKDKGNKFFQDGHFADAIECYDNCILKEPENPIPYSNKAMSLIKKGSNEQAIRVCNVALTKINSSDPSHVNIKHKIEYRLNLARNALKESNKGLKKGNNKLEEVIIQEVDELPEEYVKL